MQLVHEIAETRHYISEARNDRKTIGFVPTMGALHDGHMTLVERAKNECDLVAVSIFVNPTQFGPNEDFTRYPRTLKKDAAKCEKAGVDLVFAPSAIEMYPEGFDTWVEVKGPITEVLEGESRPGHFRGVATVCTKLFNIVRPDRAYFGTKDYQQLKVIQKLVRDLDLGIEIVPVATVREGDGLAMSSRNQYLSPEERSAALLLNASLEKARKAYDSGERNANLIELLIRNMITAEPLADVDYVAVVDAETLQKVEMIDKPVAVLLAVRVGKTRLIDNKVLGA